MADVLIAPHGHDAIQVGGATAIDGTRSVAMMFDDGADTAVISLTPELFRDFAAHVAKAARLSLREDFWPAPPRV